MTHATNSSNVKQLRNTTITCQYTTIEEVRIPDNLAGAQAAISNHSTIGIYMPSVYSWIKQESI